MNTFKYVSSELPFRNVPRVVPVPETCLVIWCLPESGNADSESYYSHIRVVHHQERQEKSEDKESSPVFRRPSLSQQIKSGDMAAYQPSMNIRGGGGTAPTAPASLATLASGTTFAAAARAAELNAAKASRQRTKDAAVGNEVPAIEPLSLGALKFTKSRRG